MTLPRVGWVAAALLLGGIAMRLLWLATSDNLAPYTSESHYVGLALAQTGQYADAFGRNSGPTAHLAPLTPLVSALFYKLFGMTKLATVLLSVQAILVATLGFALAWRAFDRLGSPLPARLAALAVVALLPLQVSLEVRDTRSWEVAIAAAAIAAMLGAVLRLDEREGLSTRALLGLGLANGAIAVLNPAAGLASSGMIGVLLLRQARWTRWIVPVAATLAVIVAVIVPWAAYNQRNLGTPVLYRSSFGISLAFVYHDDQLTKSRRDAYNDRFEAISPMFGEQARADYLKLGEVEYNRRLADGARAWIAAHPAEVRRIRLENVRDFYFPPEWHFSRFAVPARATWVRAAILWVTAAAGLLTLAVMLWRRHWRYLYVGAAVVLPMFGYVMTYPLLRYRYLVSTLLIFLAFDGALRLWRWWRQSPVSSVAKNPVTIA